MEQPLQLQFLDFDDLDSDEVEYVQTVLYARPPRLELPWVDPGEIPANHWNQHPQYEGGGECGGEAGGGGEVYPVQVPVATTIQQVYHQVVPQAMPSLTAAFVSNLTANVNVHGFMPSNVGGYVYPGSGEGEGRSGSGRRGMRTSKPSPKSQGARGGNDGGRRGDYPLGYPPPYPTALVMTPPGPSPYQYHHHMSSAQHAAGLYVSPAPIGMYAPGPPPPAIYSGYPPPLPPTAVYSPQGHIQPQPQQPPPPESHIQLDKKEEVVEPIQTVSAQQRVVSSKEQPLTPNEEIQPVVMAEREEEEVEEETVEEVESNDVEEEEAAPLVNLVEEPTHTEEHPRQQETLPPAPVPEPPPPTLEKAKSLPPINAIKTTSLPSLPPVKRRMEESGVGDNRNTNCAAPSPASGNTTTHIASTAAMSQSATPSVNISTSNMNTGGSGPQIVTPPAPMANAGKTWAGLFKEPSPPPPPPPHHLHHHPQQQQQQHHHHHQQSSPQVRKPPLNAVAVAPPPTVAPSLIDNSSPVSRTAKAPLPQRSAGLPQPEPQDDPVLRRMAEALSQYQLEHKAIVLTPRGLTNPSNYCYINATLQALLACPPFYNLIKTIALSKPQYGQQPSKSHTPVIDSMIHFIKEFSPANVSQRRREKTVAGGRGGETPTMVETGQAFEPTYVYKILSTLRREAHVEGRQEDAEEFLSLLLNGLHDEMLELSKLVDPKGSAPLSNGDVANGDSHQEDNSDWKEVTNKGMRITRRAEFGRTPLSDIFMGQLRSRVHRGSNEESTDNVQPFFTLQLDIESSGSVNEALEKLIGWDPVEGLGHLQHTLDTIPCVLILHLKCFDFRHDTCSKIFKALEFPVDLRLDPKLLSNKIKSAAKSRQYKLFAVVYHDGKEASKGHYLSDVFHVGIGGWIRYDDSTVKPVSESQVLNPASPRVPYLLYYRRADTIGHQPMPPRSAVRLA